MGSRLKSIICDDLTTCIICGARAERHHIFGASNRHKSTKDGLIIPLCAAHHREGPDAVHVNSSVMTLCHVLGQIAWEEANRNPFEDTESVRARFRARYGKNYI